jgi:EAL domain-containing protein (putative c-di-GMP-specific phosphodiesterase class I)
VNVSGQQLADPDFAELVLTTIATAGATPSMLGLEVTESLLMDHQQGLEALARLRETGIDIAIDDFGTGYSSLSALRRLPVDTLKVDRSFVAGLGSDDDDGTIVRAVLALARGLRLSVVAEGVETTCQQHELQQLGCDSLQGFLFGRPMPFAALLAWRHGSTEEVS